MQRYDDVTSLSFFVRLGQGFCGGGFGFRFRGFVFAAGRSGGRGGIFFGRVLVFFAAVVGDVKSAALEKQPRAAADFFLHLAASPFFPRAKFLGANQQRRSEERRVGKECRSRWS